MKQKEKQKKDYDGYEDYLPSRCPHCGLDLDEHDGSGFCPPGTEEAGGRR